MFSMWTEFWQRTGKFNYELDGMDEVGALHLSANCDMYAFYVQLRMAERAKRFRAKAVSTERDDFRENYFNSVDRHIQ
jgi:hypothetical protein